MTRAAAVAALAFGCMMLTLGVTGCRTGEVSTQVEQDQASKEALAELLKYAQETGQSLVQIQRNLDQWRAAQQQEAQISSVEADLAVLRSLLSNARAAVDNKQVDVALGLLKRMARVARGVMAELPGQRIALRVERALMSLSGDQPDGARAAQAILSALDATLNAREAALVPDVVKDLEAAKAAATSDAQAAKQHLMVVLDKCGKDQAATWAYFIVEGLDGAFGAVQREAWPVAAAELEQVEVLVKKLQTALAGAGEAAAKPATETPGGEQSTGTPQAVPAPSGVTPQAPGSGQAPVPTGTAAPAQ